MKKIAIACLLVFLTLLTPFELIRGADEEFEVNVRAVFADQRVAGVTFDITGEGTTKTTTSTKEADTVFSELTEGEYTIKVTFSGDSEYESADGATSKTVELSESKPTATVIFNLQKKAPPVDDNLERIKNFKWPAELTKVGSRTTDLAKLQPEQLAGVENFTFDNPGVNQIIYTQSLNLEDFESYKNVENIADYIDLETIGKVEFDVDLITPFDKEARVVMQQVNLVEFTNEEGEAGPIAIIKRDGDEADDLKNMKYEGKTLSFVVPGFSTYTLAPRLSVVPTELDKESEADVPSPTYTADSQTAELTVSVDNLDAEINVTNNNEVIDIPITVNSEGQIKQEISLSKGDNKIRVTAKLDNGETAQEIINIKYQAGDADNDVSKWFTVGIIILVIGALCGGLGYMYYRRRKLKGSTNPDENLLAKSNEPEKPKYEEGLLTEEEKEMYDMKDETAQNKPEVEKPEVDQTKSDIMEIEKRDDQDLEKFKDEDKPKQEEEEV